MGLFTRRMPIFVLPVLWMGLFGLGIGRGNYGE